MISPRLALAATVLTLAVAVPSVVAASESASATTASATSVSAKTLPAKTVSAATATATSKKYANCTAVHRVYSGGIAKAGVTTNTVTSKGKKIHKALKGTVKTSTSLYTANKKLDADKDGVACEKA